MIWANDMTEIAQGTEVKLKFINGENRYGALMDNRKKHLIYRPVDGINTIVFHKDLKSVAPVYIPS